MQILVESLHTMSFLFPKWKKKIYDFELTPEMYSEELLASSKKSFISLIL